MSLADKCVIAIGCLGVLYVGYAISTHLKSTTSAVTSSSTSSEKHLDLRVAPDVMVEAVERFSGEVCNKATWDVTDSTADQYAIDCEGGWTGVKFYYVKLGPSGLRVVNKY